MARSDLHNDDSIGKNPRCEAGSLEAELESSMHELKLTQLAASDNVGEHELKQKIAEDDEDVDVFQSAFFDSIHSSFRHAIEMHNAEIKKQQQLFTNCVSESKDNETHPLVIPTFSPLSYALLPSDSKSSQNEKTHQLLSNHDDPEIKSTETHPSAIKASASDSKFCQTKQRTLQRSMSKTKSFTRIPTVSQLKHATVESTKNAPVPALNSANDLIAMRPSSVKPVIITRPRMSMQSDVSSLASVSSAQTYHVRRVLSQPLQETLQAPPVSPTKPLVVAAQPKPSVAAAQLSFYGTNKSPSSVSNAAKLPRRVVTIHKAFVSQKPPTIHRELQQLTKSQHLDLETLDLEASIARLDDRLQQLSAQIRFSKPKNNKSNIK